MKHLLYPWPSAGHLVINKIDVISKEVAATLSSATASSVSGPGSWNYRKPTGPSNLEGVSAASCHFLGDSDSIQCGQSISEAASTLFLSAFFDCMNKTGLRCVCKERGGSGFNVFGNSPQPLQTRVG